MSQDAQPAHPRPSLLAATRIAGSAAAGPVVFTDVALSFWGGVDAATGIVTDRHHPLHGRALAGTVLALPGSRGSCTGSAVLLELILNGHAPAALVFPKAEAILSLGALVAEELFGRAIAVMVVAEPEFARLATATHATIIGNRLALDADASSLNMQDATGAPGRDPADDLTLTAADRAMLAGANGRAHQAAMRITLAMARITGATRLVDIAQAHVDGCIYTGPASLAFARRLRDWGGRVTVPTTLNAISVDAQHWSMQGVDAGFAGEALALAQAYVDMGAAASFTCAPYHLASAPRRGDHIAWAESNAVVYANSVIGARTAKYPDFLDICIALTGRAPLSGCHLDTERHATLAIDVADMPDADDALWPLLGHCAGALAGNAVPVLIGLEQRAATADDLRAFAAAFATTSGAAMVHIVGHTPEAPNIAAACGGHAPQRRLSIGPADLAATWTALNGNTGTSIDLVALGNPHFSLEECRRLAAAVAGRQKHPRVAMTVTCGRDTLARAEAEGVIPLLTQFGARIVTDTCWCMIGPPLIAPETRVVMTNSGKYAHYGPGLTGRSFRFGSLAECVAAAIDGEAPATPPGWLQPGSSGTSSAAA